MATFTITSTSAYENLTGSTGADTYNINGGTLIIKTDTRYCSNHTANTGNIGNVTISTTLGGNFIIDGTSVRLIKYNNGTGTVPNFGTTIAQGSVSAKLCGVWSALNVPPTSSGSSMPTSGYIKVIEKTGGNFTSGALSGISANSTSDDVVGWIEVVGIEARTINVSRLGSCVISGDWYYVDNTTGSSATTYQLPASLDNTFYAGVWIETSANSNDYEFYPNAGSLVSSACPTDIRGKVCWISSNGVLRLGFSGSSVAGGFLPSSGLKIRIPNIVTLNATSTTMTVNAVPNVTLGTRYDFTTVNSGVILIDKANLSWYPVFSQPYSCVLKNTSVLDQIFIAESSLSLDIDNIGVGVTQSQTNGSLVINSCFSGGYVKNSTFCRFSLASNGSYVIAISNNIGITFSNNKVLSLNNRTAGSTGTWTTTNAENCNFYNNTNIGGRTIHTASVGCNISGTKYSDNFLGELSTTISQYVDEFYSKSSNCLIEDIKLLLPSSAQNHPYGGLLLTNASNNIIIRNIGTYENPLVFGTTNSPAFVFTTNGNCSNIKAQRIYVSNIRTFLFGTNNSDTKVYVDNCFADYNNTATGIQWLNSRIRGVGCNITSAGQTSVYGTHWSNCFTSTTEGRINLFFNEKNEILPSSNMYSVLSGSPKFTSNGSLFMSNIGDSIEFEMDYFALGYTSFKNIDPTIGGGIIGNYLFEYKIKTSGDYSEYKLLNGSNLSSEIITSTNGFKLKIKITTTVSNSSAISSLNIFMNTTYENQNTLYPLEEINSTLEFTNIVSGSEIRIYEAGTTIELIGIENSSNTFSYNYTWVGIEIPIDIVIFNVQYQPVYYYNYQLNRDDTIIPVQQIFDRNYRNP